MFCSDQRLVALDPLWFIMHGRFWENLKIIVIWTRSQTVCQRLRLTINLRDRGRGKRVILHALAFGLRW